MSLEQSMFIFGCYKFTKIRTQLKLILFDLNITILYILYNIVKKYQIKGRESLLVLIEQTEINIKETNLQDCRIRQCIYNAAIRQLKESLIRYGYRCSQHNQKYDQNQLREKELERMNMFYLLYDDDCFINLSDKEIDQFFVTRDQDIKRAYNLKILSMFYIVDLMHSYSYELQVAYVLKYT
ncbi:unnamed protein product (macronuclear) [Paramecium tetraurelia]|uniref:Uncharacterized protein n=1 Tax=Paramecium tetraurelia TaxID=5888 RepID=A0C8A2_PARTE|nr:uncharacterized protein GSPATT00036150001 [Paramecium tetraurelia]CAK67019.1 unnamed protein product [Paramecium tetraurelia]|eukprot:XP_001434416.1 hypothetical protein (macronuclear) [Paramecium tetraurelia strain d4-2]